MQLQDKVVVVTGGAGGIGAALGRRFAAEGARRVVLVDLDAGRAEQAATEVGTTARGVGCDVGDAAAVSALVEDVITQDGPIDLFCANAGIALGIEVTADDAEWQRMWQVNTMSIVYAARALLPGWLERGQGYLLVTASAAGLLSTLGDAAYSATKHAAVGLAEYLSITYGDRGVKVSCLCPQGVRTPMVFADEAGGMLGTEQVKAAGIIEPDQVADAVVATLAAETFLVLPHPQVREYFLAKANDHDRWLGGMRKFQRTLLAGGTVTR
ncbi:MAG: SDR family oxidoreductase [Actinomycetota bacterium]|nr:SDR family oxidoreductase [Actinomycetota bacterium]